LGFGFEIKDKNINSSAILNYAHKKNSHLNSRSVAAFKGRIKIIMNTKILISRSKKKPQNIKCQAALIMSHPLTGAKLKK
jgi:hypothetical protein